MHRSINGQETMGWFILHCAPLNSKSQYYDCNGCNHGNNGTDYNGYVVRVQANPRWIHPQGTEWPAQVTTAEIIPFSADYS